MSQKILNDEWITEFVARWSDGEKEYATRLAYRLQKRVKHAMDVLDRTPVGEEVVFEGACPSGSTYEGVFVWDGTDETRENIAKLAYRLGGTGAQASWLVSVKNVRKGILAARLRTGGNF